MQVLVDLLPLSWQSKAKAIIAAGGGAILGYVVIGLVTGQWDSDAFAGLVLAFIGVPVLATPNRDYQAGLGRPLAGPPVTEEEDEAWDDVVDRPKPVVEPQRVAAGEEFPKLEPPPRAIPGRGPLGLD